MEQGAQDEPEAGSPDRSHDRSQDRSRARLAVGVDVGGTKVLGALVCVDAGTSTILEREQVPSEASGAEVVDQIVEVARDLVQRAEGPVEAVGAGLAGLVGHDGVVVRSPNVPGIEGLDVAARLRAELGIPAVVDNDANCVAVAAVTRREPPVTDLVAVTLGTGIGGGIVVGGRLLRGARGFAGEPGHMVVDPDGPLCPCGQRGCWERYASGTGLEWLAGRRTGRAIDGEEVTTAAGAGEPWAIEVLEEFAGWVALGVANLIDLFDPAVVVLGGGIVGVGDLLLGPVRDAMAAHPMAAARRVPIEVAPGGSDAGVLGAALSALRSTGPMPQG